MRRINFKRRIRTSVQMITLFLSVALVVSVFKVPVVLAAGEPELTAPSALLMENSSGKILYEKNIHERRPLASVTKIMTMLLAMEHIDSGKMGYDDIIIGSAHAKSMGGSTIFLDEGEHITVRDIMKGIAVASGNDAAVAMAEHICGTEAGFVTRMNERASELGMANTNFVNSNGLDAENHYSSAYDIALMSRELLKHPDIHQFTTIWMDSLRNGEFTLSNTNKLIRYYNGATGLKTGSTDEAHFCISATAKRDNMHLIAVIMGAPTSNDRSADASALLNYGFANYGIKTVSSPGEALAEQYVAKGKKEFTSPILNDGFELLVKKGENPEIEMKPIFTSDFIAPITSGDKAGVAEFYFNGEKIGERDITFNESIEKMGFADMLSKMLRLWASGGADRA